MRAAVCRSYGPPESIAVEDDYPPPALAEGQVRVRVGAASVNFPDVLLVANQCQMTVPAPFIPGSEFAGTVTEVADGVTTFSPGDRVMGDGVRSLTGIPHSVSAESAAGFGVAHRKNFPNGPADLRSFLRDLHPAGTNIIIDPVGGGLSEPALRSLRWAGRFVSVGMSPTARPSAR